MSPVLPLSSWCISCLRSLPHSTAEAARGLFFSRLNAWDWQALSALVPVSLGLPACPAPISGRAVGPLATTFTHGPHTGKAGCATVEAVPLSMF